MYLSKIEITDKEMEPFSKKFQAINHCYRGKCHWAVIIMTNFGANFRSWDWSSQSYQAHNTETQREPKREKEKKKGKTLAIFLPGKQKFLESRLAN